MGRYGAPRPVRYACGVLIGASVFAATSVAMFSLAASAGSSTSLLSPLSNTLSNVTGGLVNTVNNTVNSLTAPSGLVCQLLCSVGSSSQSTANNPIGSTLQCLSGPTCSVTKPLTPAGHSTSANGATSNGGSPAVQPPAPNAAPANGGLIGRGGGGNEPPALPPGPAGVAAGSLVQPAPSSINLPTATSGINFGKAPFLWPLFLGLDVLGAGAVVLALRKTWSRPVAD